MRAMEAGFESITILSPFFMGEIEVKDSKLVYFVLYCVQDHLLQIISTLYVFQFTDDFFNVKMLALCTL